MSALCPKTDIVHGGGDVRFGSKADIRLVHPHVRYSPKSRHPVANYARTPMGSVVIAAIQRDRSDIDQAEPFH
jgi:hypothetical protein